MAAGATILATAGAVLSSALNTATAAASAAGYGAVVAGASATVTAAASALVALGPAAPFAAAAIFTLQNLRKAAKGVENRMTCKSAAANYAVELALQRGPNSFVRLYEIPTDRWPSCWHRGLRTSDRKPGRMSFKLPAALGSAVIREDALPDTTSEGQILWLGSVSGTGSQRGLVIIPWLGPFAVQTSTGVRKHALQGLSPLADAALIDFSRTVLEARPAWLGREARRLYLRLLKAGALKSAEGRELAALLKGLMVPR